MDVAKRVDAINDAGWFTVKRPLPGLSERRPAIKGPVHPDKIWRSVSFLVLEIAVL